MILLNLYFFSGRSTMYCFNIGDIWIVSFVTEIFPERIWNIFRKYLHNSENYLTTSKTIFASQKHRQTLNLSCTISYYRNYIRRCSEIQKNRHSIILEVTDTRYMYVCTWIYKVSSSLIEFWASTYAWNFRDDIYLGPERTTSKTPT